MAHQVLARKYRPKKFADLIGQEHIVLALSHAFDHQRLHHAYLFTGTRGVGKTTTARIIAKCLNCEKGMSANPCGECQSCIDIENGRFVDLIEIDAASKTKVEDTRELLENVMYAPTRGRIKVYLIDEVHMLSGHSFNALLKTLEEPPEHVVFLLATTDPQKLPVTVLSRCLQFQLKALSPEKISPHLAEILKKEKIAFEPETCELLALAAKGSMRDGLSLLDQAIASGDGEVKYKTTSDMLGIQGQQLLLPLVKSILEKTPEEALKLTQQLANVSADFEYLLEQLTVIFHDLSIKQLAPQFSLHHPVIPESELTVLAKMCDAQDIQLFYQIALHAKRDLALAPSPSVGFQMALLRMMAFVIPTQKNAAPTAHQVQKPQPQASAPTKSRETQSIQKTQEEAPRTSHTETSSWHELLPKLGLSAFAKTLAEHLHFESLDQDHYYFSLEEKNAPMLQEKHRQKILAALEAYFGKTFSMTIQVGRSHQATPSVVEHRENTNRQKHQDALKGFQEDETLQKILSSFDGKIAPESLEVK